MENNEFQNVQFNRTENQTSQPYYNEQYNPQFNEQNRMQQNNYYYPPNRIVEDNGRRFNVFSLIATIISGILMLADLLYMTKYDYANPFWNNIDEGNAISLLYMPMMVTCAVLGIIGFVRGIKRNSKYYPKSLSIIGLIGSIVTAILPFIYLAFMFFMVALVLSSCMASGNYYSVH